MFINRRWGVKKTLFFLGFIALILLVTGCVGGAGPAGSGNMTLDQAIQAAAENIENNVQEGQKIAVLNFSSPTEQFSAYVLEELSTRIVNGKKLVVVERRELDLIRQEENFQMSGEVSDESALSIGKKLGAQLIVSGSLSSMGHLYRFRIRALNVESAAVEAASATDIRTGDTRAIFLLSGARPVSVNVQQPSAPAVQSTPQSASTPTPTPATVTPAAPVEQTVSSPNSATGTVNSPDWLNDFPPEDAIWGIGIAKQSSAAMSRAVAEARAHVAIVRHLDMKVQAMFMDYNLDASTAGSKANASLQEDVSRQITNMNVSSAWPVKRFQTPDGTWWYLLEFKKSDARNAVADILRNKQTQYTQFKVQQALQMLDAQLAKNEKPMQVNN
jgi:TolB-like protein